MTIAVEIDFCKENISDFSDLANAVFEYSLAFGRELVRRSVEERDAELREERDKSRYVNKGKRKTCLKTLLGDVELERTVYVDKAAPEGQHCVFLLDEDLGIDTVGLVSPDACEAIANAICETTYRGAAQMLSETSGLTLSPQGVWGVVQKLGAYRGEQIERLGELAKVKKSESCIETELFYEEDDGVWLPLQGKDRKKYGPSKEMKVGIAYDGVLWSGGKSEKERRELHNKVAYTSFDPAAEYRERKEGLVASRFNVNGIKLRIRNGDGAGWVQGFGNADINVLDVFHRNKALLTHVQNTEHRKMISKLLYGEKDIPKLLAYIEGMMNSEEDTDVQEHYRTLLSYYKNNADGLLSAYDHDIPIPDTSEPGVIHHARLGSMESNVFTLVGNRMKGRRACWSIRSATNLANLLCLYHTTGFAGMFTGFALPAAESPAPDRKPLSASKVPLKAGKGYECQSRATVPNLPWLKAITGYQFLAEIRLS